MLTVLHTNDMHDRLTDRQAEELRRRKSEFAPDVLLLDAGDAIGAGNITYRPSGEPILRRMSSAGYDAMAVGNREFHITPAGFACKLADASFPVLCANVRSRNGSAGVPCRPTVEFQLPRAGRVAVFGLTVRMVTEKMPAQFLSSYIFEDPIAIATNLANELRDRCDLLVCLSHCGVSTDQHLAATVPSLDLIVGGHSHTPLANGIEVGDTLIVQAPPHARAYGIVTVSRDRPSGRLTEHAALQGFGS